MERLWARLRKPVEVAGQIFARREVSKPVRVVTDSTSDIPPELAKSWGVMVVPCNVLLGEETFRDNIDITREELYQRMLAEEVIPTTSQPSVEEFKRIYRDVARETDQIVSIHLAARLSGTLNSARLAAQELPELNIAIIDSQNTTMALGLLALRAARAAREGKDLAEIVTMVEEAIARLKVLAVLDTLKYIQRSGRIGKASAFLGNLLQLKPIIQLYLGEVSPVEKVRSKKRAIHRLAELVQGLGPIEEMAVLHTHTPQEAQELKELLRECPAAESAVLAEASAVVGTHTGPGAVGVALLLAKDEAGA